MPDAERGALGRTNGEGGMMRRGDSGRVLRLFFRMRGRLKVVVTVLPLFSEVAEVAEPVESAEISRDKAG